MSSREDRLAYLRAYHAANRDRLNARSRAYYQANKLRMNSRAAAYAQENADTIRAYQQEYSEKNKERLRAQKRDYSKSRPEYQRQKAREYYKAKYREIRTAFLHALGGACYCCGLADLRFLTIDHADNDGAKERKPNGKSLNSYTLISKMWQRFQLEPERYRAACYNCNCARSLAEDKICPHQKK